VIHPVTIELSLGLAVNSIKTKSRCFAYTVWLGALLLMASPPAVADDPAFLSVGMGYYDIFDDDNAAELRVDYRSNLKFLFVKPFAGAVVTSDGAFFPSAGLYSDFYFGRRIVISLSSGAGYYFKGDGKDLGHAFEIRSGVETAYRFDSRARLGLMFYHISNAGLEDDHRGTEVLGLSYSIPLN